VKYESVWRKLLERSFPHAPFKNFNRGKKRDCFLRLLLTRRGRRLRRPELFQTIAAASSGGPLLADARHPFAEQMDSVPPPHPLHNICLPVGEGLGPSAAMAHRRTNGRIWNSPLRDSNTPVGEAISLPRRTQITTQAGRRGADPYEIAKNCCQMQTHLGRAIYAPKMEDVCQSKIPAVHRQNGGRSGFQRPQAFGAFSWFVLCRAAKNEHRKTNPLSARHGRAV